MLKLIHLQRGMLNRIPSVQVSDTSGDDSSDAAGYITKPH